MMSSEIECDKSANYEMTREIHANLLLGDTIFVVFIITVRSFLCSEIAFIINKFIHFFIYKQKNS